nr:MAG TPA: hypothetical protein [Caudoviricetes sp.]
MKGRFDNKYFHVNQKIKSKKHLLLFVSFFLIPIFLFFL